MRAYVDNVLANSTSQASPGGTVSWTAPVFPGDTLHFQIEINSARRSNSRRNLGIVEITGTARGPRQETVMRYAFTGFFGFRESTPATAGRTRRPGELTCEDRYA